ncbi:MAG: glycine cleavage system protein GcvH [Pseudomonadota bacterium]
MSNTPDELKYTKTHEWVKDNGDGTVTVGISDHAQELLGDLVFVELPEAGSEISAGDEVAVVESVKAASDIYSPLSGKILGVNEVLNEAPESINDSPYDEGWLFTLKPDDDSELGGLLDAAAYSQHAQDEEH